MANTNPLITGGPGTQDATAPALNPDSVTTGDDLAVLAPTGPEITGMGSATRSTQMTAARSDIRLALASHLTRQYPGMAGNLDAWIEPLITPAYEVMETSPQFFDMLRDDIRVLQGLTDEGMRDLIAGGSAMSELEPLFNDIVDTYYDLGVTQLAQLELSVRSQGLQQTFEGKWMDGGKFTEVLEKAGVDIGNAAEIAGLTQDERALLTQGDVLDAMGRIDREIFTQPGIWAFVDGKLVMDFESDRIEGDDVVSRFVIDTAAGTTIDNTLDAMVVLVESQLDGSPHEILTRPSDIPGDEGTLAGMMIGLRDIARWSESKIGKERVAAGLAVADFLTFGGNLLPDPAEQPSAEVLSQRMTATDYPAEFVLAEAAWLAAEQLAAETGEPMILAAGDVFDVARSLQDSPLAAEASEAWKNATNPDFIEQLEDPLDERSELEKRAQGALDATMSVMEKWDNVSHAIGVYAVDMVADYVEGGQLALKGDIAAGFEKLSEAVLPWNEEGVWDWEEHAHVSERLAEAGIDVANDPDWAQAIDFASVVVFDPLNLMAAGPKSAAKIFAQAMTNPRFARVALSTPSMRAVTKKIAAADISDALHAVVEIADGMDTDTFRRIVRLATDPNSTIGDVQTVLMDALPSSGRGGTFWLANGPRRWERRSTANGLASVLGKHGDALSDEALEQITLLFGMQGRRRGASVVDADFLNGFLDVLDQSGLTAAQREHWMLRAADVLDEQRAMGEVLDGAAIAKAEEAKISRTRIPKEADDLPQIEANLRQVDDAITRIQDMLPGVGDDVIDATLDSLVRQRDGLAAKHAQITSKVDAAKTRNAAAHKQNVDATRLARAGESRAPEEHFHLARLYHEFYEEQAEALGLKQLQSINPFTGNRMYDWTPIRGESTGALLDEANPTADMLKELGMTKEELTQLRAAGYLNVMNRVPLPVSQYELAVYKALEHNPTLRATILQKIRAADRLAPSQWLKKAFAVNLLLNPMTGFKAHLDETIRFLADTGDWAGFAHASVSGLPGVGSYLDRAIRAGFKLNTNAAPYLRQLEPFGGAASGWKWLERPTKKLRGPERREYLDQADRWVNGVLVRDDIFSAYAEAIQTGAYQLTGDGTALPTGKFAEWWDQGGNKNVRTQLLDQTGLKEITPDIAFKSVHAAFEATLEQLVDEPLRAGVRRAMLEAATTGTPVETRWLRAFNRIPGQESARGGVIGSLFDVFFGAPAQRRGSVFFDRYYAQAHKMFSEAYNGRVVTADMLLQMGAVDTPLEASMLIARGTSDPTVRNLVSKSGMVTEQMIEQHAASYATRRADDLMYRLVATSIAGEIPETALMFPYTRAQMDFVSWWSNHLTRPMQARLSNETRLALSNKLPRLNSAIEAMESVPLNLRALSRYSHILSGFTDPSVQEGDGPLGGVFNVIDTLTFLPLRLTPEIATDLVPSPGPLPLWAIDLMFDKGDDHPIYQAMNLAWPTIEYTEDNTWDFLDYILPASRRSARRLVGNVVGRGIWQGDMGTNPEDPGPDWVFHALGVDGQAPGTTALQKSELASIIATNGLPAATGSAEWQTTIGNMIHSTIQQQGDAMQWDPLRAYLGLPPEYFDSAAFNSYQPLLDAWDDLLVFGVIPSDLQMPVDPTTFEPSNQDDAKPLLQAWYDRWKAAADGNGDRLTREDLFGLADRLGDVFKAADDVPLMPGASLRDYLVAMNPELAVNLVSSSECADGAPVDWKLQYCSEDGRIQNVPLGADGRDWWDDAKSRNLVQFRDIGEVATDIVETGYSAQKRVLAGAWQQFTGIDYSKRLKQSEAARMVGDMPQFYRQLFTDLGVGNLTGDLTDLTLEDLRNMVSDRRAAMQTGAVERNRIEGSEVGQVLAQTAEGRSLLDYVLTIRDQVNELEPDISYRDWPAEAVDAVKDAISWGIDQGLVDPRDYRRSWEPMFGPLDYQFEGPPTDLSQVENVISVDPADYTSGRLAVVDGDTVSLLLGDQSVVSVRLLGINAPEVNQPNYKEAANRLQTALANANQIDLVQWDARKFGAAQAPDPSGRQRVFLWLYIDGVPIFDPSQFTATNQRGVQSGSGSLIDFDAILSAVEGNVQ